MCYSAQSTAAYQELVRTTGATLSLQEFAALYAHDPGKRRPKTPKAMDDAFRAGASAAGLAVWAEVEQWNLAEALVLEQELFANRKRLADAERALQVTEAKKAREDVRIAGNKIDRALAKLADLKRTEPKDRDSRIFPGVYAPVIVSDGGKLIIRPMRYQCRLAGKPANYDQRYPGTYNARRDSLEKFWAPAFGHTHGLLVVDTFYENVEGPDGRTKWCSSRRARVGRCWWSACGHTGLTQLARSRICCPSPRSPMTRNPRWLRPGTKGPSSTSSPSTSTPG
jgi:hypothetical protein